LVEKKITTSDRLVKCKICTDFEAVDLMDHIGEYHAITIEDYLRDYPDALISYQQKPPPEDDPLSPNEKMKKGMSDRMESGGKSGWGPKMPTICLEVKQQLLDEISKYEAESKDDMLSLEEKLRKYPECPQKDSARVLIRVSKIIQLQLFAYKKWMVETDQLVSEGEKYKSKIMLDTMSQLKDIMQSLDKVYIANLEHEDVAKIYEEEQESVELFIQDNIGEFSFRCDNCHHIIDAGGLDKWYYEYEDEDKDTKYHVWSRELWFLWKKKIIPYWIIPFVLRTGILGVLYTYQTRSGASDINAAMNKLHLPWKELEEQEKKYKEILMQWEQKELKLAKAKKKG